MLYGLLCVADLIGIKRWSYSVGDGMRKYSYCLNRERFVCKGFVFDFFLCGEIGAWEHGVEMNSRFVFPL